MCLAFQDVNGNAFTYLKSAPVPSEPDAFLSIPHFYVFKAVCELPNGPPKVMTPCYPGEIHPGWNTAEGNMVIANGQIGVGALHLCVTEEVAHTWSNVHLRVIVAVTDIIAFSAKTPPDELAVRRYYVPQEEYNRALAHVTANIEAYHAKENAESL